VGKDLSIKSDKAEPVGLHPLESEFGAEKEL